MGNKKSSLGLWIDQNGGSNRRGRHETWEITGDPWRLRVSVIRRFCSLALRGHSERALDILKDLTQICALEDPEVQDADSFLVDQKTAGYITRLNLLLKQQDPESLQMECTNFIRHLSPPASVCGKKRFDFMLAADCRGLEALSLCGAMLKDKELLKLDKVLDANIDTMTHLDLSYNRLTDHGLQCLLPTLEKMQVLQSLDLVGNYLRKETVDGLVYSMADPSAFPSLTQVALGNNYNIAVMSGDMCQLLLARWSPHAREPSLRELATGQVTIVEAVDDEDYEDPDILALQLV
ncbi:leucine-rich repeat-containing protein 75A-like isoform X1 [Branchiostoma lanceolatum]|uniref:leucine-rich repeat-containing protein 75A-like isoform X1 n=1 Tax=Branchiostoma lanceolatum TaxID=7740 RepID=UPI00345718F2